MKKNIINILLSGAAVLALAACSENDWNDKYLDGFKAENTYDDPASGSTYTLTEDDYSSISKSMQSLAGNDEETAQAKAIGTTMSFDKNSIYNAKFAIPYFLNTTSNPAYNGAVKSTVDIVYAETGESPEELYAIGAAKQYTVSTANYQDAWGSTNDYISAYAPSKPASNYLPGVLKSAITDATSGQYAVVTYNYATTDPIFGTSGDDDDDVTLTANIKDLTVGNTLTATAIVTAQSSRGLILTDDAGSILYYNTGVDLSTYPIGTIVKVSGEVAAYNKGFQLTNTATLSVVGSEEYTYPTPTLYTGEMMTTAVTATANQTAQYIAMQGEIVLSGNYINVNVEGTTVQGSVYYATDEIKNQLEDGESYTLYGYFTSFTGSYFYIVVTKVGSIDDDPNAQEPAYTITSAIKDLAVNDNLKATAVVTAIDARGMVLTDNAGSILYYQASGFDQSTYTIGDVLTIDGTVSAYNKGLQLANTATTVEVVGHEEYTYPQPTVYDGAMMDQAITATENMLATYVAFTGTMSISGNYYNVIVDGATTAQGSLYYISDALKSQIENGKDYTFYGYYMAISSGKYFNIVLTSVADASSSASLSLMASRAAINSPVVQEQKAVYYFNGSAWVAAENVIALAPADYASMGFSSNQLSDPNIYLPIWLKQQKPYAQEGDEVYVLYNTTSAQTSLFIYNNGTWTMNNNEYEVVTGRFVRVAYNWEPSDWQFQKYIGKQTYVLFNEDEIQRDATYLIAAGSLAMAPVSPSKNFGYPEVYAITPEDGMVTLETDIYGFTFATTTVYNETEYEAPEGYFMLVDAYGSYYYLQGTYTSFNIRKTGAAYITDGAIDPQYLFYAVKDEDGNWAICNDSANGTRTLYLSVNYNSYGAYFSKTDDYQPTQLYKLDDGSDDSEEGDAGNE